MNIFDRAMDIEKEGESLYRQLSSEAPNMGMRNIFAWLADKEAEHCEIFRKMREGIPVRISDDPVMRDPKEIFAEWKDYALSFGSRALQAILYRRALAVEIKSILTYKKYADSGSPSQRKIFFRIADEEEGHQHMMGTMIEFITKPEGWVEKAEFSRTAENYYL